MSLPSEDAASVLETFISDASNLPAEIAHIYEEIRSRDTLLLTYRETYLSRDRSLQNHIRAHGSLSTDNPKEPQYVDQIRKNMKRVQELQDEKLALAQKALDLIEKHARRLDGMIGGLVRDGVIAADAMTPAAPTSNLPAASQKVVGGLAGVGRGVGVGGGGSLTDRREAQGMTVPVSTAGGSGVVMAPGGGGGSVMPVGAGRVEGPPPQKKVRLPLTGPTGIVAAASTNRPGTPGRVESRAGTPSGHSGTRKTGRKKPPAKRKMDDEDEDGDEGITGGVGGEEAGVEGEDGEQEDKRLYCMCQQVSYGSMVGCDDKECPYEWFHWSCVGLTEEPKGKWYCPTCQAKRDRRRKEMGGGEREREREREKEKMAVGSSQGAEK